MQFKAVDSKNDMFHLRLRYNIPFLFGNSEKS